MSLKPCQTARPAGRIAQTVDCHLGQARAPLRLRAGVARPFEGVRKRKRKADRQESLSVGRERLGFGRKPITLQPIQTAYGQDIW